MSAAFVHGRTIMTCDGCGRFVSTQAIADGSAVHRLALPSSQFTKETHETLCGDCSARDDLRAQPASPTPPETAAVASHAEPVAFMDQEGEIRVPEGSPLKSLLDNLPPPPPPFTGKPLLALYASPSLVRDEVLEEAAKVAEAFPPQVISIWDRPGGPPGNGFRSARMTDVAAAIRALKSVARRQQE